MAEVVIPIKTQNFTKTVQQLNKVEDKTKKLNTAGFKNLDTVVNKSTDSLKKNDLAMLNLNARLEVSVMMAKAFGQALQLASPNLTIRKWQDELIGISNRLKLVTQNSAELISVQKELSSSSREVGSTINNMSRIYANLFNNLDNSTPAKLQRYTKGIAAAMSLSAGDVSSREAGLTQLLQGLGGTLQGQELRSVFEQLDYVAVQLRTFFKMNSKQLIEYASTGAISGEKLTEFLEYLTEKSLKDFGNVTVSNEQAFNRFYNSIKKFTQTTISGSSIEYTYINFFLRLEKAVLRATEYIPVYQLKFQKNWLKFTNALGITKNSFQEFAEGFSFDFLRTDVVRFTTLVDNIYSALTSVDISGAVQKMLRSLKALRAEGLLNVVFRFAGATGSFIKGYVSKLFDATIGELRRNVIKRLKAFVQNLRSTLVSWRKDLLEILVSPFESIKETDVFKQLKRILVSFNLVSDVPFDVGFFIGDKTRSSFERVTKFFSDSLNSVKSYIEKKLDEFDIEFNGSVNLDFIKQLYSAVVNGVKKAFTTSLTFIDAFRFGLTGNMNLFSSLESQFADALPNLIKFITNKLHEADDFIKEAISDFKEAVNKKRISIGVFDSIKFDDSGIKRKVLINRIQRLVDSGTKDLTFSFNIGFIVGDATRKALEAIKKIIQGLIDNIFSGAKFDLSDLNFESVTDIAKILKRISVEIFRSIKDFTNGLLSGFIGINNAFAYIGETFSDNIFISKIENFIKAISNTSENIKGTFLSISKSIRSGFRNLEKETSNTSILDFIVKDAHADELDEYYKSIGKSWKEVTTGTKDYQPLSSSISTEALDAIEKKSGQIYSDFLLIKKAFSEAVKSFKKNVDLNNIFSSFNFSSLLDDLKDFKDDVYDIFGDIEFKSVNFKTVSASFDNISALIKEKLEELTDVIWPKAFDKLSNSSMFEDIFDSIESKSRKLQPDLELIKKTFHQVLDAFNHNVNLKDFFSTFDFEELREELKNFTDDVSLIFGRVKFKYISFKPITDSFNNVTEFFKTQLNKITEDLWPKALAKLHASDLFKNLNITSGTSVEQIFEKLFVNMKIDFSGVKEKITSAVSEILHIDAGQMMNQFWARMSTLFIAGMLAFFDIFKGRQVFATLIGSYVLGAIAIVTGQAETFNEGILVFLKKIFSGVVDTFKAQLAFYSQQLGGIFEDSLQQIFEDHPILLGISELITGTVSTLSSILQAIPDAFKILLDIGVMMAPVNILLKMFFLSMQHSVLGGVAMVAMALAIGSNKIQGIISLFNTNMNRQYAQEAKKQKGQPLSVAGPAIERALMATRARIILAASILSFAVGSFTEMQGGGAVASLGIFLGGIALAFRDHTKRLSKLSSDTRNVWTRIGDAMSFGMALFSKQSAQLDFGSKQSPFARLSESIKNLGSSARVTLVGVLNKIMDPRALTRFSRTLSVAMGQFNAAYQNLNLYRRDKLSGSSISDIFSGRFAAVSGKPKMQNFDLRGILTSITSAFKNLKLPATIGNLTSLYILTPIMDISRRILQSTQALRLREVIVTNIITPLLAGFNAIRGPQIMASIQTLFRSLTTALRASITKVAANNKTIVGAFFTPLIGALQLAVNSFIGRTVILAAGMTKAFDLLFDSSSSGNSSDKQNDSFLSGLLPVIAISGAIAGAYKLLSSSAKSNGAALLMHQKIISVVSNAFVNFGFTISRFAPQMGAALAQIGANIRNSMNLGAILTPFRGLATGLLSMLGPMGGAISKFMNLFVSIPAKMSRRMKRTMVSIGIALAASLVLAMNSYGNTISEKGQTAVDTVLGTFLGTGPVTAFGKFQANVAKQFQDIKLFDSNMMFGDLVKNIDYSKLTKSDEKMLQKIAQDGREAIDAINERIYANGGKATQQEIIDAEGIKANMEKAIKSIRTIDTSSLSSIGDSLNSELRKIVTESVQWKKWSNMEGQDSTMLEGMMRGYEASSQAYVEDFSKYWDFISGGMKDVITNSFKDYQQAYIAQIQATDAVEQAAAADRMKKAQTRLKGALRLADNQTQINRVNFNVANFDDILRKNLKRSEVGFDKNFTADIYQSDMLQNLISQRDKFVKELSQFDVNSENSQNILAGHERQKLKQRILDIEKTIKDEQEAITSLNSISSLSQTLDPLFISVRNYDAELKRLISNYHDANNRFLNQWVNASLPERLILETNKRFSENYLVNSMSLDSLDEINKVLSNFKLEEITIGDYIQLNNTGEIDNLQSQLKSLQLSSNMVRQEQESSVFSVKNYTTALLDQYQAAKAVRLTLEGLGKFYRELEFPDALNNREAAEYAGLQRAKRRAEVALSEYTGNDLEEIVKLKVDITEAERAVEDFNTSREFLRGVELPITLNFEEFRNLGSLEKMRNVLQTEIERTVDPKSLYDLKNQINIISTQIEAINSQEINVGENTFDKSQVRSYYRELKTLSDTVTRLQVAFERTGNTDFLRNKLAETIKLNNLLAQSNPDLLEGDLSNEDKIKLVNAGKYNDFLKLQHSLLNANALIENTVGEERTRWQREAVKLQKELNQLNQSTTISDRLSAINNITGSSGEDYLNNTDFSNKAIYLQQLREEILSGSTISQEQIRFLEGLEKLKNLQPLREFFKELNKQTVRTFDDSLNKYKEFFKGASEYTFARDTNRGAFIKQEEDRELVKKLLAMPDLTEEVMNVVRSGSSYSDIADKLKSLNFDINLPEPAQIMMGAAEKFDAAVDRLLHQDLNAIYHDFGPEYTGAPDEATEAIAAAINKLDSPYLPKEVFQSLLTSMARVESGFNSTAVSPKGAQGMFQIMPATAANPGYGVKPVSDPFDVKQSAEFAASYMNSMLKTFNGDISKAILAYNQGAGTTQKGVVTSEGGDYVNKVLGTQATKIVQAIPQIGVNIADRLDNLDIAIRLENTDAIGKAVTNMVQTQIAVASGDRQAMADAWYQYGVSVEDILYASSDKLSQIAGKVSEIQMGEYLLEMSKTDPSLSNQAMKMYGSGQVSDQLGLSQRGQAAKEQGLPYIKDGQEYASDLVNDVHSGFTSGFQQFFKDGDIGALGTGLLDSVTASITNMVAKLLMDTLFESLFNDLFSSIGSSLTSLIGGFSFFADGGYVSGPGTNRSDSIPARLSNGEFVINAESTKRNRSLLESINSGKRFANGGYVGISPTYKEKGMRQEFNINVTGDVSSQTRRQIITMIPQITQGVNAQNKEKGFRN